MKKPVFSIVIPCYNVEAYIDRCLSYVVNQTFTDWECILINDGSTDSTPDICNKWKSADNRFLVIHQSNGGVSSARNAGIDAANGDYILFVDPDDWIPYNTLDVYARHIGEYDLIRCSVDLIGSYGNTIKHVRMGQFYGKDDYLADILSYNDINRGIVFGCCSRDLIILNHIRFDERYKVNEDYLALFYLLKAADKCKFLDETLYYYDIGNSNSCCHQMDYIKDRNFFAVHNLIYKDSYISDSKWAPYKSQGTCKSMCDIIKRLLHSDLSTEQVCNYIKSLSQYYPSVKDIIHSSVTYKYKLKLLYFKYCIPRFVAHQMQVRAHKCF